MSAAKILLFTKQPLPTQAYGFFLNMKAKILFLFGMLCASPLLGQDDLLAMLNQEDAKKITYTQATFKGTRFINGQTVETIAKKHLVTVGSTYNDKAEILSGLAVGEKLITVGYGDLNDGELIKF
jgi:hypothetical protein